MRTSALSVPNHVKPIPFLYTEVVAPAVGVRRPPTISVVPRGRALFWQGDEQDKKIEIVEGVVRAVRLLENGNRQILAFYWPGDVVMPTHAACQQFTAEAVTN